MKGLLLSICLFPLLVTAQENKENPRLSPLVRAVNDVMPSTVIIGSNTFNVEELGDFKVKLNKELKNLGTGVIIDESGLIITNEHVIRGNDDIRIFTFGNKEYPAKVLHASKKDDLALLQIEKVEGKKFKPIKFSWPGDLYLAESVATIGNPLGLSFSISKGILSATRRKLEINDRVVHQNLLQTDIKVNPGNSGGPLINMEGKMIGIMVGSQTKSHGIGFAIPVDKIERILANWLTPENQANSEIGFKVITEFNRPKRTGRVVIKGVQKGRLNSLLGIKNDMVITKIDDVPIKNAVDFYRIIRKAKTGQQLVLTTGDKKSMLMQLFPLRGLTLAKARLGLEFQRLGPDIARAVQLPFDKGFVLSNIDNRLNNIKIQRGDMLFKIGNKIIMNDRDLQNILKNLKTGEVLDVVFFRVNLDGEASTVEVINDKIRTSMLQ